MLMCELNQTNMSRVVCTDIGKVANITLTYIVRQVPLILRSHIQEQLEYIKTYNKKKKTIHTFLTLETAVGKNISTQDPLIHLFWSF